MDILITITSSMFIIAIISSMAISSNITTYITGLSVILSAFFLIQWMVWSLILRSVVLGLLAYIALSLLLLSVDSFTANNNGGKLLPPKLERKWCYEGNKVNCGWISSSFKCW